MLFTSKLTTFAAIAGVSLLVIPVARAADILVTVGGPGILQFNPNFVNASVGDVVKFTFQQKNHTATQSTLQNPCTPAPGGFDSGFVPVADTVTSGFPVAELTIKDTSPVWVFCRQAGHCQQGMVFAVNPGDKFAAFQAAATGGAAPPPPASTATAPAASGVVTVTATVTAGSQTLTTTYASFPGSAAPTIAASTDHKVIVGGPGSFVYNPANITAQPGDTVTFEFRQKNHTVTASSFAAPCRALSATSTTGQVGFDSGFMPVADNATTFPTYTIQVNDTTPIWAYCRQPTHCGMGMVFSVNAVESGSNTFEAFQAKAKALNGTTSSTSPSGTSAAPSASSTSNSAIGSTHGRGAGIALALVGIAVGLLL